MAHVVSSDLTCLSLAGAHVAEVRVLERLKTELLNDCYS